MKLFTFNLDAWMVVLGLKALRDSTLAYIGSSFRGGWSGGAMVQCKLPVPGRPTIWITVG